MLGDQFRKRNFSDRFDVPDSSLSRFPQEGANWRRIGPLREKERKSRTTEQLGSLAKKIVWSSYDVTKT